MLKMYIFLLFFNRVFVPSPNSGDIFRCTEKSCSRMDAIGKGLIFVTLVMCCQFDMYFKNRPDMLKHIPYYLALIRCICFKLQLRKTVFTL